MTAARSLPSFDWPLDDPEVFAALEEVYRSGDWGRYHGHQCQALTDELSGYHEVAHVLLCASGTVGVELALRGLGVTSADEVILAGYDFPGNFRAVEAIGARPVLVDLAPHRWTIGVDALAAATSQATRAVVVSHLHGDMAPIRELVCESHRLGLQVVEDACQATGAMIGQRRAGAWADVGVISFGGSKLLTAGRGGALLTDRPEVMQRAKICAQRGNEVYPLSELQAAVVRPQLKKLNERNERRRTNVQRLLQQLQPVERLQPPTDAGADVWPSYYKLGWSLRAVGGETNRAELLRRADALGLPLGSGFRGFFRRSGKRCRAVGDLAGCRQAAEVTVLLHHPALLGQPEQIAQLAAAIRQIVEAAFTLDTRADHR